MANQCILHEAIKQITALTGAKLVFLVGGGRVHYPAGVKQNACTKVIAAKLCLIR